MMFVADRFRKYPAHSHILLLAKVPIEIDVHSLLNNPDNPRVICIHTLVM